MPRDYGNALFINNLIIQMYINYVKKKERRETITRNRSSPSQTFSASSPEVLSSSYLVSLNDSIGFSGDPSLLGNRNL